MNRTEPSLHTPPLSSNTSKSRPWPLRFPTAFPPTFAPLSTPARQQAMISYPGAAVSASQQQPRRVQSQPYPQSIAYQGFHPDDMELDVYRTESSVPSSGAPPDTPVSLLLSCYSLPTPCITTHSAAPSLISMFDTTVVPPSAGAHHHSYHHSHPYHHQHPFRPTTGSAVATRGVPKDAFNAYARHTVYSSLLADVAPLSSVPFMQHADDENGNGSRAAECAPTTLLFNGSAANASDSTPMSSRVALPVPGGSDSGRSGPGYDSASANARACSSEFSSSCSALLSSSSMGHQAAQTARASTTLSRAVSSFWLSKPFKCAKPNCNRSYKHASGLKYHMTHGSRDFTPPKSLEHFQELLASKCLEKTPKGGAGEGDEAQAMLSYAKLEEVEEDAERRLRPYACGVGECQRRYRNMNSLQHHYQHSGDHGVIGLALLANEQDQSRHVTLSHSNSSSVTSTRMHLRTVSRHSSPPPAHQQAQLQYAAQQQRQEQPPTYRSALASPPAYPYQPNAYALQ